MPEQRMSVLEIASERGHDTLQFDRATGKGVTEAGAAFDAKMETPGAYARTRKFGDAESHKITSFDQAEDQTAVAFPLEAG